ncbi:hypothetical protein D3C77_738910 [compost metagenome]
MHRHRLQLDRAGFAGAADQRVAALAVAHRLQTAAGKQCGKAIVDTVLAAQAVRLQALQQAAIHR